ncbi:Zn-ribbon domain-containing OB-fold protein [Oceaniglobus ichthyenteri]|uniref:Zn-ribbon domain-containing OB-fold protein n=1 Tax=Oceaniglobus ichthyenteri TaxID=2136177 RepID=UPI0013DDA044|nr:Zn-ribbon domain-containing OB-fold protein [Oceaniglobus ichthyenteri]
MSKTITGTPLPEITDQTRPFWDAANENKLVMQKCTRCGTVNFPPKPWCIECGSRDIPWTEVGPGGTVYSFTISRSVAMNWPDWDKQLPVILCLVDVDDGARMYAQVVDCAPEKIAIGMRLKATFAPIGDGVSIPKFVPADTA